MIQGVNVGYYLVEQFILVKVCQFCWREGEQFVEGENVQVLQYVKGSVVVDQVFKVVFGGMDNCCVVNVCGRQYIVKIVDFGDVYYC